MGVPEVPTGMGGLPVLPGEDPYDLDRYGQTTDPNDWQLWWQFNRDRFLRFSGINTGGAYTGSDGFYLGTGAVNRETVGGRASDSLIDTVLSDALQKGIQKGCTNRFSQSALVAMSKVGGEHQRVYDFMTRWYLANGTPEMHPTAAFILGVMGGEQDIELLRNIALNTKAGCEAITPEGKPTTARVPMDIRSFAAYGLGMIGSRSPKQEVRQDIVKALVEIIENDASEANDARVAAMIAMGLVPLHVDQDVVACYCGTCVVPDPHTSLRPQVTYLMRYFTATKEFDPVLRSHTATTLARLVAARPEGMTNRMKEGIAEVLIRALRKSSRQPENVRESSVLALGLIGDADNDPVDEWIRWQIRKSIKSGGDMEKRFALISLAEVGGHRGQGEEPFSALPEIRSTLRGELTRGKKRVKPWAALAVGLLGFELGAKGQPLDEELDTALGNVIRAGKRVDDLGAFALAAGMRGSIALMPKLRPKVERTRDAAARGYVAMGLGMLQDKESIEVLKETFAEGQGEPVLQMRTGLALGLLGEGSVVDGLLESLTKAAAAYAELDDKATERVRLEAEGELVAAITALGYIGDKRALDELCRITVDEKDEFPPAAREAAVVGLGMMGDRSPRPWRLALTMGANYRARTATLTTGERTGVLDLE